MSLTFHSLNLNNADRLRNWHGPETIPWIGSDWSNAMCGEAGEAANVVKKLRRIETNTYRGTKKTDGDIGHLIMLLERELADTVIYADLLAEFYGLSLGDNVVAKFNAVSLRENLPQRLQY